MSWVRVDDDTLINTTQLTHLRVFKTNSGWDVVAFAGDHRRWILSTHDALSDAQDAANEYARLAGKHGA